MKSRSQTSDTFVAVDLGASSGRVMLAEIGSRIRLDEIHRFPNHAVFILGHHQWDFLGLFQEIKIGLAKIAASGRRNLSGIGVDTWGVDFGFTGRDGVVLGNPYCYRDVRTRGMMDKAFQKMSKTDLYEATGNQFMEINSVFQLLSMVESRHPILEMAETLLFMPDLFHFLFTGEKRTEYTIASTSQMLNARTRRWDESLFHALGLPFELMSPIVPPGTVIGPLLDGIRDETGLVEAPVIASATHDTASAVTAVPARGRDWAFLSSGTWSLLGVELDEPMIGPETMKMRFSNEGSTAGRIRLLRNATGMWMLEQCRKSWEQKGHESLENLLRQAGHAKPFRTILDPDDPAFMNPPDMPKAIAEYCARTGQPVPQNQGDTIRGILESLALRYRSILDDIQALRKRRLDALHIMGGGSRNTLLNQFTADASGLPVVAGPVEATALGNVIVQAVASGVLDSIETGRALVAESFPLNRFEPGSKAPWDEAFEKFKKLESR